MSNTVVPGLKEQSHPVFDVRPSQGGRAVTCGLVGSIHANPKMEAGECLARGRHPLLQTLPHRGVGSPPPFLRPVHPGSRLKPSPNH